MRKIRLYILALTWLYLFSPAPLMKSSAQTAGAATARQDVDVDRILAVFKAKETEFRRVLRGYGFKREATIQSLGQGARVLGEYHRVSYLTFDAQGAQREKIVTLRLPTLTPAPEDLEDLNTIEIFAVEAEKIDSYRFTYVGRERVDELNTYVFDVAPKVLPEPGKSRERFFQGRIWIDDQDMQLVKAKGKGVPEGKQRFPTFETYREQIDGHYWFPSLTYADDRLDLPNGTTLHIRMRITFTDYQKPPWPEMLPGSNAATQQRQQSASTEPGTSQPKAVTGVVLNGKALKMPQPEYPKAAKKAGIKGTVRVRVVIDEQGRVIKAEAIEGPEELREAAIAAALKARFTPTLLEGQPVKVTGEIGYNFVP